MTTTPTTAEFKRALLALRPIAPHHLQMLRAHYRAPGHTLTASQIAAAVDYQDYHGVNLHYGKFAGALCEQLGRPHEFSIILDSALPGDEPPGHLELVMRRELVEALDDLCWAWASSPT